MTGYIKKYYGDDSYFPDSARKRYNRYVDDHQEIMVFNFGGGGGGCCGGGSPWGLGLGCCHHSNTFWGGFAHAFGAGIANFLGGFGMGLMGFCSPMFNMFGGFCMPSWSMPAWNMPMWGNYMSYSGVGYGGVQTTPAKPANPTKPTPTAKEEIEAKFDELKGKTNPTPQDLNNFVTALNAKKDSLTPEEYKVFADELKTFAGMHNLTVNDSDLVPPVANPPTPPTPVDGWTQLPLKKLGEAKITQLKNIGVKPVQVGSEWCLSLPDSDKMTVENLTLLKDTGINVAVANNSNAKNVDNWIAGKIDDIRIINNSIIKDSIHFTVDCSTCASSAYNFTYNIQQQNQPTDEGATRKWTITYKSGYDAARDGDLWHTPNPNYQLNNGRLETNSNPVISKHQRDGYTKLT